jgi:hypothetical protein
MGTLLLKLVRFFLRNAISFFLIVGVFAFGTILYDEAKEILSAQSVHENWRKDFDSYVKTNQDKAASSANLLANMGLDKIDERINAIDIELKANEARLKAFAVSPRAFVEKQKIEIANSYLAQERGYLIRARDRLQAIGNREGAEKRLEELRQAHVNANNAYQAHQPAYEQCRQKWHKCWLHDAENVNKRLLKDNNQAYKNYQDQKTVVDSTNIPTLPVFVSNDDFAKELKATLDAVIDELHRHWIVKAVDLFKSVAWQALTILLSILLTPVIIKAVFYYMIAPYAARRPPICALPSSGCLADTEEQGGKISGAQVGINFSNKEELLLAPDCAIAFPSDCKKDTRWFLDKKFPFTSVAAGMYGLTEFRSDSPARVVASPQADPFAEIGIVTIQEGSAMVFEPHNLVGVVQRRDRPMRISSHWHLFSPTAWLTLQLRVLVFHGPVRLVVQGCKGVILERADGGRNINQGAAIGYSANLNHSVARSETFPPYCQGKQELFDDRFDGSGHCVSVVAPFLGSKSGVFGRGIEGAMDSVLKVFGV